MDAGTNDMDRLKKLAVLYVEDDQDARDQISEFLSRHVGSLFTAADGAEALELFVKHRPHIVISDIQMPVMNGLELVEKVRRLNEAIPIVMITAHDPMDYVLRAAIIEVDKYVVKPVDGDRLLSCLYECSRLVAAGAVEESGPVCQ